MIKTKSGSFDLKNIILISFAILFFCLLTEMGFRIYYYFTNSSGNIIISLNPKLVFEHRPGVSFRNRHGVWIKFNSLGFIGEEIRPRQGQIRILGLGDSITEAAYLTDNERYLNRIGLILEKYYKRPVEVINGAVAGYNSWQQLELLKTRGLSLDPELIIFGLCINDSVSYLPSVKSSFWGGIISGIRDGSKARYLDFLYQKSDFYKFVYDRLATRNKRFKDMASFNRYLKGYDYRIPEHDWLEWKNILTQILEVLKAKDKPVLFVIFPLQNQVIKDGAVTYAPLSEFFIERKTNFIDLSGKFSAAYKKGNKLYLDFDIIHPTNLGQEIAARMTSDYIVNNNILGIDKPVLSDNKERNQEWKE